MGSEVWVFLAGQLAGAVATIGPALVLWLRARARVEELTAAAMGEAARRGSAEAHAQEVREVGNGMRVKLEGRIAALEVELAAARGAPKV